MAKSCSHALDEKLRLGQSVNSHPQSSHEGLRSWLLPEGLPPLVNVPLGGDECLHGLPLPLSDITCPRDGITKETPVIIFTQ